VRWLACSMLMVLLSLAGPGCAVFKKNTDVKPATTGGGTPPAKFPTSTDPIINGGSAAQVKPGAVLAGRVIDNYSKPPANTSIRLVSVDGKDTAGAKDVDVMPDGYFIIQGLKSGAHYKLLARGKNGEHVLAGITQTTAPNLTVVIQVKEEFANLGTPPVQGSPAFDANKIDKTSGLDNPRTFSGNNTVPTTAGERDGNDLQIPPVQVPVPGRTNPVPTNQGWMAGPNVASEKESVFPPLLDIPNPTTKPALPPLRIPQAPPAMPPDSSPNSLSAEALLGGARVPSCVLVGKRLENFALNDINMTPWELKKERRGKLVLLDFWGTWCPPCRESIPTLVQLQAKHRTEDLEVVGIAVENDGTPQEQAYRVDRFGQNMGINYRQLLSTGAQCPVKTDLRITHFPTMVLLDQDGTIIWRHTGVLDRTTLSQLERIINRGVRGER
jgi:thiol-disulfide isomerase/thioredoxin